jgi:hypothetical protein
LRLWLETGAVQLVQVASTSTRGARQSSGGGQESWTVAMEMNRAHSRSERLSQKVYCRVVVAAAGSDLLE